MIKLVCSVPDAGRIAFDSGRDGAYEAARRGDIPTISSGRRKVVPIALLAKKLGVERDDVINALRALEKTRRTAIAK